ncbi:MAG: hypothetical protein ACE5R6_03975 [Candidatus Heimdallarchaeota archaeon]
MKTWAPTYHEFQKIFANDFTLKILAILSQQSQKLCAADVARILDIHISTAKKYLDLLFDYQFIDCELFPNKPGKPTYYSIKSTRIEITIDIDAIAQEINEELQKDALPNPSIRETPNLQPRITYVFNKAGLVEAIIIKRRTKAKRIVKQKITLNKAESAFMKYLPHPSMHAERFITICERAQLKNYYAIKGLISFAEKLKKYDIIEEIDPNSAVNEVLGEKHERN